MPDKKFDLGDYVEVKDRIKLFYELFGQGRLVTGEIRLTTDPDGKPRVIVQGLAYRTPDDPLPGVGWSWMELPGTTSYTRGSELENAETSAWGRAIAALGILVDRSIASAQEVQNKERPAGDVIGIRDTPESQGRTGGLERVDGGLIGLLEARKAPADLELRQTPTGSSVGFGLVGEKGGGRVQVMADGALAETLQPFLAGLVGKRVQVFGTVELVPWKKDGKVLTYQRLHLERIVADDFILPADVPAEAETAPLFDDVDVAQLDAAVLP